MEDIERYSDYNDYEDDVPGGKSPVGLILKILIGAVCFAVIGVIGFRLMLFNSYPDKIKNLYFNEKLTAYYEEKDGDIDAKTQSLSAPYDDPDEGNFFCGNLVVIPEINQLQVSARYNVSLMESIKEKYGVELSADNRDNFSFKLYVFPLSTDGEARIETGTLSFVDFDSKMMYRYYKLVFDDVDFTLDGEDGVWIGLEISINGVEMEEPYMVLIYEDTEETKFIDYKLSDKEKPGK